MKTVYRIVKQQGYQYFLAENPDEDKKLRMKCQPLRDEWQPVKLYNHKPLLKRGNFFHMMDNILIVDEVGMRVLVGFFEEAGEILPVVCEGVDYGLVNVLECINCLNPDETEWETYGKVRLVAKPSFYENRLPGPGLFKIPENYVATTYVYVNSELPESENFIYLVEHHNLTGIAFEKVWESG